MDNLEDESVKTFHVQSQPELGLSGKLIHECLQLNKQKTEQPLETVYI